MVLVFDALVTKDILKIDHNLSSISVTIMDIWRDIENVHMLSMLSCLSRLLANHHLPTPVLRHSLWSVLGPALKLQESGGDE